jgi:hypothetical protein
MAGEALEVIGSTQGSDELAGQPFAALAADLAAALGFGGLQLLLVLEGVGHGAHGGVCAVLGSEALGAWGGGGVEGVGGLSRESIAIGAGVVGVRVLRRALTVHRGRCRWVHGRRALQTGERGQRRAAVVTMTRR